MCYSKNESRMKMSSSGLQPHDVATQRSGGCITNSHVAVEGLLLRKVAQKHFSLCKLTILFAHNCKQGNLNCEWHSWELLWKQFLDAANRVELLLFPTAPILLVEMQFKEINYSKLSHFVEITNGKIKIVWEIYPRVSDTLVQNLAILNAVHTFVS